MTDLSQLIAKDLSAYYAMVHEQTHQWVDRLTEEQLWERPLAHGNSVGHLLLHMTGNLSYYIGARVAENGYVRDRDREFNETELKSKAEVLAAFDRAIAMVIETIAASPHSRRRCLDEAVESGRGDSLIGCSCDCNRKAIRSATLFAA